jgi:hypothetical protein
MKLLHLQSQRIYFVDILLCVWGGGGWVGVGCVSVYPYFLAQMYVYILYIFKYIRSYLLANIYV